MEMLALTQHPHSFVTSNKEKPTFKFAWGHDWNEWTLILLYYFTTFLSCWEKKSPYTSWAWWVSPDTICHLKKACPTHQTSAVTTGGIVRWGCWGRQGLLEPLECPCPSQLGQQSCSSGQGCCRALGEVSGLDGSSGSSVWVTHESLSCVLCGCQGNKIIEVITFCKFSCW